MINTVERAFDIAKKQNVSLFKLCEENDISYSTLLKARGRSGQLNVCTIQLLCNAMGITMSEYFAEPVKE